MRTLFVALPVLFAGTVVHAQTPAATGPADLMPVPAEVVWQSGRLPLDAKMTVATRGPDDARVSAALERALFGCAHSASRRQELEADPRPAR